jgi:hypothetical protein
VAGFILLIAVTGGSQAQSQPTHEDLAILRCWEDALAAFFLFHFCDESIHFFGKFLLGVRDWVDAFDTVIEPLIKQVVVNLYTLAQNVCVTVCLQGVGKVVAVVQL